MEQKRDKPRNDHQRSDHQRNNAQRTDPQYSRRKKRRSGSVGDSGGGGAASVRSASHPESRPGQHRGKPPSSPKRDDRRHGHSKSGSAPVGGGAPRDLRLGSPKEDKKNATPPFQHVTQRYGVLFFESFPAAKAAKDTIVQEATKVDQLNIVIKAEGDMDDPEILDLAPTPGALKIFAGAAWTLIHERRVEDGWYQEPR